MKYCGYKDGDNQPFAVPADMSSLNGKAADQTQMDVIVAAGAQATSYTTKRDGVILLTDSQALDFMSGKFATPDPPQ